MTDQTPEARKAELAKLDRAYKRTLAALRRELLPGLKAALNNDDGFARLNAITDEEWQAAVDADEEAAGG